MTVAAMKPTPNQEPEVRQEALALIDQARAITITTDEEYEDAAGFLRGAIKAVRARVEAVFGPIIRKAHEAHREALAQRQAVEAPLIEAERVVKLSMARYVSAKAAERRRIEEEQRRTAREAAEREMLERAAELERQGQREQAEALIEQPVAPAFVAAPTVEAPKAAGIAVRKAWKFRVVEARAIKPEFLMPDEKKIGQIVRSMGADAVTLVGDGIEVWSEEVVAARVQ